MKLLNWLFRSLVTLFLSILCIGGGTAISIVGVARGAGDSMSIVVGGGVALAVFGGYLALLVSPVKGNIRFSGAFSGMSVEMSRREGESPGTTQGRRIFGSLALLCASVICVGGGVAVAIVAIAAGGSQIPAVALMGGIIQTLFGGYMGISATGANPMIKASGNLREGVSLELKEE